MFMQIFVSLFIGGFVTVAAIGHIALLHALCAPVTDVALPRSNQNSSLQTDGDREPRRLSRTLTRIPITRRMLDALCLRG